MEPRSLFLIKTNFYIAFQYKTIINIPGNFYKHRFKTYSVILSYTFDTCTRTWEIDRSFVIDVKAKLN